MNKRMPKNWLALFFTFALLAVFLPTTALAEGSVARVGDNTYSTLKDAFEQAPDGATVVLLEDISDLTSDGIATVSEDKALTLDMNGKSITVTSGFKGRPIVNYGTLTVTGNGTIDSSASEFDGYGAINNYGVLTIENGTFRGSVMADGSVVYVRPGAEATINGGTFEGSPRALSNEGKLTVNGGTFTTISCNQTTDSKGNKGHWAYCVFSSGELYFYDGTVTGVQGALSISKGYAEIYGGTFQTVGCKYSKEGQYSYYALYIAGEVDSVEVHISGGEYTSVSRVAVVCGNDNTSGDGGINAKATAYITGGSFTGGGNDRTALQVGQNTGDMIISGGIFTSKVPVEYCAQGYVPVDADEDGKYTVHSHKFETWQSDDTSHWRVCTVCGAKDETSVEAHTSDGGVVTTEATTGHDGVRTYSCTVCGKVLKTETIPQISEHPEIAAAIADGTWGKAEATPAPTAKPAEAAAKPTTTTIPQTGDASNPALPAVVMIAALLGLCGTALARRRGSR